MKNWSTNTSRLQKNSRKWAVWKLEQLINFGLNDEKISKASLQKYWSEITIDPAKRRFLSHILWPKAS